MLLKKMLLVFQFLIYGLNTGSYCIEMWNYLFFCSNCIIFTKI